MRTALVIVPPPSLNDDLRLDYRHEPVQVQALVPQAAVEGLDERIIGRPARPGEVDPCAMVVGPEVGQVDGLKKSLRRSAWGRRATTLA